MVATSHVPEPLLRIPLLEAMGRDTKETLAEACDKYEESVDAKEIMDEMAYANGSIARILDAGIYHSDNAVEEDGTEDIDWLDVGEDAKEEMDSAMKKILDETKANTISKTGYKKLENMLQKYRMFSG